ncbi:unnamed protein product [Hyaloperonospora brassicae]|uniref:RxLR effector protein n=1 Tax=Hyaloperonospora brassicae TaxID=162125 RepID=A0AAV0UF62_HYABA|nr:unnamed protein product [Hyaloperonospora brassicae]
MLSTKKLLALLTGLLLSSRATPLTTGPSDDVATPLQETATPRTRGTNLLRVATSLDTGHHDDDDDRRAQEERRLTLQDLMAFDDITNEVKAGVMRNINKFVGYREADMEVLDLSDEEEKKRVSLLQVMAYCDLYEVYLTHSQAFDRKALNRLKHLNT